MLIVVFAGDRRGAAADRDGVLRDRRSRSGIVALIGRSCEFNLFVTNMISMIGLAVGIDYSLFIVSRYREERKKGYEKLEAIGAAGATANRAVFFSGMTVVLALLGMFIMPTTIFRSLAAGAILVTLVVAGRVDDAAAGDPRRCSGDRINWPRLSKRARLDTPYDAPRRRLGPHHATASWPARAVFLIGGVLVLGVPGLVLLPAEQGQLDEHQPAAGRLPSKRPSSRWSGSSPAGVTDPAEIVITGDVTAAAGAGGHREARSGRSQPEPGVLLRRRR